jgi:signal transduction histidine kinase
MANITSFNDVKKILIKQFNNTKHKYKKFPLYVKITIQTIFIFSISLILSAFISFVIFKNIIEQNLQQRQFVRINAPFDFDGAPNLNDEISKFINQQIMANMNNFLTKFFITSTLLLVIIGATIIYYSTRNTIKKVDLEHESQLQFMQNASHDLRTPLTSIKGYAELLLKDNANNKKATRIIENSKIMEKLISDMLFLAKVDSNNTPVNIEKNIDIVKIITNKVNEIKQLDGIRCYEIITLENEIIISTDTEIVNRILDNLFSNIKKYTQENANVKVFINQDSKKVFIIFQDNGPGVSKDDLQNIFNRFYRVDNSRNVQGSGLGLSIVKELVNLLNGNISATSDDKGLRIKISLNKV